MAYVATQHERIRIRSLIVSDQNSIIYCLKSKHLLGFICLISPIKNTADAQLSLERAWPGKFVSKLHISWENAKAVNHAMKKKSSFYSSMSVSLFYLTLGQQLQPEQSRLNTELLTNKNHS